MKQPHPSKFVNAFGAKWLFIRLGFNVAKLMDINIADKIVLSIIISMSTQQRPFNGGYEYLGYRTAFEIKKIQSIVRKLKQLGYIKTLIKDNRLLMFSNISTDKEFIPVFDVLLNPPEATERPPLLDIVLLSWVLAYDFSKQDFPKGTTDSADALSMSVNSVQSAIKRLTDSNKIIKIKLGKSFMLRPTKKTMIDLGLLEVVLPNKMNVTPEAWEEILEIHNKQASQFKDQHYRHKWTWKENLKSKKNTNKITKNTNKIETTTNKIETNANKIETNTNKITTTPTK